LPPQRDSRVDDTAVYSVLDGVVAGALLFFTPFLSLQPGGATGSNSFLSYNLHMYV
jgi:hypothetical protein